MAAEGIPSPRGLPILGNALALDAENPLASLCDLATTYGEAFKLSLGGRDRVFICGHQLLDEVMDEKRFEKAVTGALIHIRSAIHDGLFTALPGEHNWEVAHRTLMPAFGPIPIHDMFEEMHDIATQLILKWARFGPDHEIKVTEDFTRLTLDSIALCAMGTRFNSFYTEEMHPFVNAMVATLLGAQERARRPAFVPGYFYRAANEQFDKNVAFLAETATSLVRERRQNPVDKKDLLNAMLFNKDPKTGEKMTEESIANNMITFLIAGHETTSGLLSFVFYELLKNPQTYKSAQQEVDEVIGEGPVTVQNLSKLKYINAVLRETLRLHPPAPAFTVTPKQDEVIGGKYHVTKGTPLVCFLMAAHRDPSVYGENAEDFRPERMLDGPFSQLPPNSWKPFGNGARGCIGRPFSWQEALLVIAMILQNFDLSMVDPTYELEIQSTLTIKPKGFSMRAKVRHADFETRLSHPVASGNKTDAPPSAKGVGENAADADQPTMSIYYGSNMGTCEAMAHSLASSAGAHGFRAKVDPLDKATDALPTTGPVVILTSSYEGEPPDNAVQFVSWLKSLQGSKLGNVKYAVFGCGNRDWHHTYHKIPTLVDTVLAERGAERLVARGAADANDADLFDVYDTWKDEQLWPATAKAYGKQTGGGNIMPEAGGLDVEISTGSRTNLLRQDLQQALVLDTDVLTAPGGPQKRHMEIRLPPGSTYRAGDYLAVLPFNPLRNVRRALARFELPWDVMITISPKSHTTLPKGRPIALFEVFSALVELSQPATSKQVKKVAETVAEPDLKAELEKLAGDDFKAEVIDKNASLLDILERYPAARFPLGQFLDFLPAMRIRQYSISSSPLKDPTRCTITYTVLNGPVRGAKADDKGRFLGVSSNHLATREPGDWIQVAVRSSHAGFHLPVDDKTPVLMVCAGTGLAPFRAFVQERVLKIESGKRLAPALLFYGCSSPSRDDIYAEELANWQQQGAVDVRRAYSRESDKSFGCRHVQDRIWHDRSDAKKLFAQDAQLYMCGAGAVGAEINQVMARIYVESKACSQAEADEWVAKLKGVRYWADVFA